MKKHILPPYASTQKLRSDNQINSPIRPSVTGWIVASRQGFQKRRVQQEVLISLKPCRSQNQFATYICNRSLL